MQILTYFWIVSLKGDGLPSSDFYAACKAIEDAEGMINETTESNENSTAAQLNLVAKHVKNAMCNLVSQFFLLIFYLHI